VPENKYLHGLARRMQLPDAITLRRWALESEIKDWRALSEAASQEQDPEKLMQLVEELNLALLH